MSELRRDPVHGHWTIIAADRGRRPFEFPPSDGADPGSAGDCPLCPGHEDRTPPEILAVDVEGRPAPASGWAVRVVPNLFPALDANDADGTPDGSAGTALYRSRPGYGAHEVVIESTRHDRGLGALPVEQAVRVLEVCRDRIRALGADPSIAYVLLFKNRGRAAGASLAHPHLQILATPIVPDAVTRESDAFRRHRERTGRCLFCDIVQRETAAADRLILDNGEFVALAPYASRVPFESMILPRRHQESFADLEPAGMQGLAGLLQDVLARMDATMGYPPYNLVLHTPSRPPVSSGADRAGDHWHIEILPRLARLGGFEWGAGIHINPVPPEESARRLRPASGAAPRSNRSAPPTDGRND